MNGNSSPEVLFLTLQNYSGKIVDASTSTIIYQWRSNEYPVYAGLTTTGSNTLKVACYYPYPISGNYSLVVYTLGIATSVSQQFDFVAPPNSVSVEQNFPNPFNPNTTIEYSIPHSGFVNIEVFDITGRLVKTLVSENQSQGTHLTSWDGYDNSGLRATSGSYFYVVKSANSMTARKMILLK